MPKLSYLNVLAILVWLLIFLGCHRPFGNLPNGFRFVTDHSGSYAIADSLGQLIIGSDHTIEGTIKSHRLQGDIVEVTCANGFEFRFDTRERTIYVVEGDWEAFSAQLDRFKFSGVTVAQTNR